MLGYQKFVQYIRMLCPGRFILVESVTTIFILWIYHDATFCKKWHCILCFMQAIKLFITKRSLALILLNDLHDPFHFKHIQNLAMTFQCFLIDHMVISHFFTHWYFSWKKMMSCKAGKLPVHWKIGALRTCHYIPNFSKGHVTSFYRVHQIF